MSSFTPPQVFPNLYEFLCSILKKVCNSLFRCTIDFHSRKKNTMEVNGAPELLCFPHSEYLPLCLAEQRHSYRFETTWGWVNDDRIFIFGWTIPLRCKVNIPLPVTYVLIHYHIQNCFFVIKFCKKSLIYHDTWGNSLWHRYYKTIQIKFFSMI